MSKLLLTAFAAFCLIGIVNCDRVHHAMEKMTEGAGAMDTDETRGGMTGKSPIVHHHETLLGKKLDIPAAAVRDPNAPLVEEEEMHTTTNAAVQDLPPQTGKISSACKAEPPKKEYMKKGIKTDPEDTSLAAQASRQMNGGVHYVKDSADSLMDSARQAVSAAIKFVVSPFSGGGSEAVSDAKEHMKDSAKDAKANLRRKVAAAKDNLHSRATNVPSTSNTLKDTLTSGYIATGIGQVKNTILNNLAAAANAIGGIGK